MTKILIIGAGGRMGRRIASVAIESEMFDVVGAVEITGSDLIGKDIGELSGVGKFGLDITDNLDHISTDNLPDVAIDFSLPEGTMHWVPICRRKQIAMVIGTTGLTESQQAEIVDAAGEVPIVFAGNYSMGINLLTKLVAQTAKILGTDYDIEVSETHHRFKKDAPSGTAIMLAKAACEGLGSEYGEVVTHGRGGHQPRKPGEIGMHALRLGDTVGEHSVSFGNLGETITFSHSAHTRDTFIRGALRAVTWVVGKNPGLYNMCDVLGL